MGGSRTTVGRDNAKPKHKFKRGEHDYTQEGDIDPKICTLSLGQINVQLSKRLQHRLNREYTEADAIQEELSNTHSVTIHDGRKIWRADGEGWGNGHAAYDIGGKEQRLVRPYNLSGELNGLSPSDVELVQTKISARSEAKRCFQYVKSDKIRNELKNDFGVEINDRLLTWFVAIKDTPIQSAIRKYDNNK
uniref:Uncharacterized protein n=1 Tax=Proboscia inermis TaxID=420281 RepID=A0A7S0CCN9_9STRA|mmetsp:Transcript_39760/g.40371  ORF Transcript_39760/g.40371 Transcript_39760/m.40371 type:complete len:191 (+) Transcript_39760:277-849(+)